MVASGTVLLILAALASGIQHAPPLSFIGFSPGMAVADARSLVTQRGGSLSCRKTTDSRLYECTGAVALPSLVQPLSLLVSSVRDSVGVMVLTTSLSEGDTRRLVRDLTRDFGRPNHKVEPASLESWQWIRRGQMLRVVVQRTGNQLETAVTLTHGPLLDALGLPENTKPD